jgi:hypothetical protein
VVLKSQPPHKFYCNYGGDGIDIGYSVKEIYNRQYIVIGSTTSFGAGGTDAYMLLVDSMGNLTWQKTFGGIGNEVGKSIVFNPIDSGFVFAGYSNSFGAGGYDFYVVRTDKKGNMLWQKNYGSNDWDFGSDLCITPDTNIVVVGNTPSKINAIYGDGFVIKLNLNNGNLIWQKNLGGTDDEDFRKVKITKDNKISVLFNSKSFGDLKGDILIVKLGLNGDSLSYKKVGQQNKTELGYDFIEDKNNDLWICGAVDTSVQNIGRYSCYILKTTFTGPIINEQKFTGAGDQDKFFSICDFKRGNKIYLSRRVFHNGFGIDIQPITIDYNINVGSAVTYGNYGTDEGFEIQPTRDNGCVLIGHTKQSNGFSDDVYLIKLDSTINNTSSITDVKPLDMKGESAGKVFFFNNQLVFNHDVIGLSFSILNSSGFCVLEGLIDEEKISVESLFTNSIYFVRINGIQTFNYKFLKN